MGTSIGILGVGGRMGRAIVAEIGRHDAARLAGGTVRAGTADILDAEGRPAGLEAHDDPATLFAASDVAIDVTTPGSAARHAALAAASGTPLVVATTGLAASDLAAIDAATARTAVLTAANFSLGVNLLLDLVRQAAARLGPDFDIEILEMHHRHKLDAPSGTALALGEAAAAGRGARFGEVRRLSREGHGKPRPRGEIGFATLRGGDVAGEHKAIFAGEGERLELGHVATSRAIFARGAVAAALWLAGKPPGRYTMADVTGALAGG